MAQGKPLSAGGKLFAKLLAEIAATRPPLPVEKKRKPLSNEQKQRAKEKRREYIAKNHGKILETSRAWNRRPDVKERRRQQQRSESHKANRRAREKGKQGPRQMRRYYSDPQFRMRIIAGKNINRCVTIYGAKKAANTMQYVGCTKAELVAWLESKFKPGMSWENYGTYWQVDHVRPLARFDLTDPEQMRAANHFTNLQPLTDFENAAKSDRLPEELCPA